MASSELRAYDKKQIRCKILDHKFGKEKLELKAEERSLGKQVWKAQYAKHIQFMETAPEGALPSGTSISVRVGPSNQNYFNLTVADYGKNDDYLRRFEVIGTYVAEEDSVLGQAILAFAARKKSHENECRVMDRKLEATLSNYRSAKKLMAEWPEITKFVKEVLGEPKPSTALVSFDTLNAALDLPPE